MGSIPAGRANKQRLRLSRSSAFVFWAANGLPFAHHARYSQFDPPNPARSADANSVRFLTVTKKHDYGNASHWEEVLGREFAKESDFAHNVAGRTFEDGLCDPASWSLQNRLGLLNGKSLSDATFQMVHGGDFLLTSLWMLWTVNSLVEDCSPLEEQKLNGDISL